MVYDNRYVFYFYAKNRMLSENNVSVPKKNRQTIGIGSLI